MAGNFVDTGALLPTNKRLNTGHAPRTSGSCGIALEELGEPVLAELAHEPKMGASETRGSACMRPRMTHRIPSYPNQRSRFRA